MMDGTRGESMGGIDPVEARRFSGAEQLDIGLCRFRRCTLASVFQPIAAVSGTPAHQALLRCFGGGERALSPWGLLSRAADGRALSDLHHVTARLHAEAYARFVPARGARLVLTLDHWSVTRVELGFAWRLRAALVAGGLAPERALVVLDDGDGRARLQLLALAASLREANLATGLRCLTTEVARVPLRDFDVLQVRWEPSPAIRGGLREALDMARDQGVRTMVTRIEDPGQVEVAALHGAEWVQGFAVGRPAAVPAAAVRFAGGANQYASHPRSVDHSVRTLPPARPWDSRAGVPA